MKGKEDVPEAAGFPPGGLSLEPVTVARGASSPEGASRGMPVSRQALLLKNPCSRESPRVRVTENSTPSASHWFFFLCLLCFMSLLLKYTTR